MKGYETYRTISVERRGRILVLTLDRPDALNAVNAAFHAELARIFVEVRHDAEADVIVLTGRGRAFCAGGDIDWMQAAIDDPALFEETGRQAKEIVFGQLDLDKPLICRSTATPPGSARRWPCCATSSSRRRMPRSAIRTCRWASWPATAVR